MTASAHPWELPSHRSPIENQWSRHDRASEICVQWYRASRPIGRGEKSHEEQEDPPASSHVGTGSRKLSSPWALFFACLPAALDQGTCRSLRNAGVNQAEKADSQDR